ncbi:MAG: hypothetical protein AB7O99_02465 [Dongiaceae bacterium]
MAGSILNRSHQFSEIFSEPTIFVPTKLRFAWLVRSSTALTSFPRSLANPPFLRQQSFALLGWFDPQPLSLTILRLALPSFGWQAI